MRTIPWFTALVAVALAGCGGGGGGGGSSSGTTNTGTPTGTGTTIPLAASIAGNYSVAATSNAPPSALPAAELPISIAINGSGLAVVTTQAGTIEVLQLMQSNNADELVLQSAAYGTNTPNMTAPLPTIVELLALPGGQSSLSFLRQTGSGVLAGGGPMTPIGNG